MKLNRREFAALGFAALAGCSKASQSIEHAQPIYDVFDDSLPNILDLSQTFDVLGTGYGWAEGPTWDKKNNCLYFTDVPGNIAYRWSQERGVETFLDPSGSAATEGFREPGANGLLYTEQGILLCNHGTRSIERLDPVTKTRVTLAAEFKGRKFNSPNDIIQRKNGEIFFTDPPYGLDGLNNSPMKEQDANGVYRLSPSGDVSLMIEDMTFPNGIALSPDQDTLYIAQSDPNSPHLYRLDLTKPDAKKTLLVDFSSYIGDDSPGLPDGMVIDKERHIFATGPGGVFVIAPNGKVLGRIKTGKGSANCTFGEDGSTLFITNHDRLIKLRTRTLGLSWS